MTEDKQISVDCPSCTSAIKITEYNGDVHCQVCGTDFTLSGHLCPECHSYHQAESTLCLNCGTPLAKTCRNCQSRNWSGMDVCVNCGASIDIFAMVAESGNMTTANRLTKQMSQAQAIKMTEDIASGKRMAELLAIEEARQAELRQRLAKQKDQEQKLLITVFGAIALFFLVLIIYAIVSTIL